MEPLKVEFPRKLREMHPLGTHFQADLKISQKTNKDGSLRGGPYAVAAPSTIELYDRADTRLYAQEIRDRVYRFYTKNSQSEEASDSSRDLRAKAMRDGVQNPVASSTSTKAYARSTAVRAYVISRSGGKCEACDSEAPFLTKNGDPYVEVHHVHGLAQGGDDTIFNTMALCPNCHRRTEHSADADEFNAALAEKLIGLEPR